MDEDILQDDEVTTGLSAVEENTEEIIEEKIEDELITEELTTEEVIDYEQYLIDIEERLDSIIEETEIQNNFLHDLKESQTSFNFSEIEEGSGTQPGLSVIGSGTGDFNLYLSGTVENASLDDIYSMAVSIRNVLLLFFLFWGMYKVIGIFKNVIYKVMNR